MVVAVATPINQYVGTGGTNTYPFTFPVFNSSQIAVTVSGPSVSFTTMVLGTDYLVAGLNASGDPASTGTITLVNAGQAWLSAGNLATGMTLTIQSNFPYSQTTSIRNQGDFYRSALENALDNLEYQIQQLQLTISTGLITLTDLATGKKYMLVIVNGVFGTQEIT
jgi:hypothetical protein